ncbi:MAG: mitochondrial fission ELM1 family protein [Halothiobacillaceae bacterium]|nr:mitochondrial fission ELM1 family protein [Halothiobacillaceae bacterium]HER34263.1 hypothetical protein [Halothiobacillaceae bacterium]
MSVVWIVSDGNPGHFNQSRAVAEAVQDARGWTVEWVTVRPRYRGFLRPLVYSLVNAFAGRMGMATARRLVAIDALPASRPSMVISSGGATAVFNVLAASAFGCANFFLGRPPLRFDRFSRILLSEEAGDEPNVVRLPFLPTPVTPEQADQAGTALRRELDPGDTPLWAMLIGGSSRSHHFEPDDWRALAAGMNRLSAQYGGRWLITTSRRSGETAESILRRELDPACIAEATWWGERPRPVVPAYLGASDIAFCTQDSLTMLTDAMASARPVFALSPKRVDFGEGGGMFEAYLEQHQAEHRIRRLPIAQMEHVDPVSPPGFTPIHESIRDRIYEGYVRDVLDAKH